MCGSYVTPGIRIPRSAIPYRRLGQAAPGTSGTLLTVPNPDPEGGGGGILRYLKSLMIVSFSDARNLKGLSIPYPVFIGSAG